MTTNLNVKATASGFKTENLLTDPEIYDTLEELQAARPDEPIPGPTDPDEPDEDDED